MIEFTKAYVSGGKIFATLEEAQESELVQVLFPDDREADGMTRSMIASRIVEERDRIIDILTTNGKSRPAARKSNGGTKRRKPKANPPVPVLNDKQPNLV